MRRFLAITAIVALILSTGLPVWAASCTAMSSGKDEALMCHRTGTHHHRCDEMAEQQDETAASGVEVVFTGHSDECPMQCCVQLQSGSGTAVVAISFLPQPATSDDRIEFPSVVFLSNGFSSHTDRGPPILS